MGVPGLQGFSRPDTVPHCMAELPFQGRMPALPMRRFLTY
jgi:hypothetical protein